MHRGCPIKINDSKEGESEFLDSPESHYSNFQTIPQLPIELMELLQGGKRRNQNIGTKLALLQRLKSMCFFFVCMINCECHKVYTPIHIKLALHQHLEK